MTEPTKKCIECGETKPLSDYYRNCGTKDGRINRCKTCQAPRTRAWNRANRDRLRESNRRYRERNREQDRRASARRRNTPEARARRAVKRAIVNGTLVRPETCEDCGERSNAIEAHHEDYSRRFDVNWLCPTCHGLRHRIYDEISAGAEDHE